MRRRYLVHVNYFGLRDPQIRERIPSHLEFVLLSQSQSPDGFGLIATETLPSPIPKIAFDLNVERALTQTSVVDLCRR